MTRGLTVLLADAKAPTGIDHDPARLPYRLDYLRTHGWIVEATDPQTAVDDMGPVRRRLARTLDRVGPPSGPTLSKAHRVGRGWHTLAVFESQGHFLALLRALLPPLRRGRLVIVVCWLSEQLPSMSPRRRAGLRFAYRGVDAIACFSPNQQKLLAEGLGMDALRIHAIPFGIDTAEFPVSDHEDPYLLAVGRDRGRDWGATFASVARCGLPLKVLCRPEELAGLEVPAHVEVLGYVSRAEYRDLLARATAVVLLTGDLAYPTGQTVLLEAMSAGKACVVTDTEAMNGYLHAGSVLAVPVGDVEAAEKEILRLVQDRAFRTEMGASAATTARQHYDARVMCGHLDRLLRG